MVFQVVATHPYIGEDEYGLLTVGSVSGLDREPRTVIHVKRAKMFDPMG